MYQCKQLAVTLAEHAYGQWTRRAGAVLDLVRRISTERAGLPGRKSVLVVSDEPAARPVDGGEVPATSCRTASAGMCLSTFSRARPDRPRVLYASGGVAAHPDRPRSIEVEETQLAGGGRRPPRRTRRAAPPSHLERPRAGLARMAPRRLAYYLLGYQPERAPDGKWHRLQVKVGRPGLEVHARRGYVATAAATARRHGRSPRTASTERVRRMPTRLPALSRGGARPDPLARGLVPQEPGRRRRRDRPHGHRSRRRPRPHRGDGGERDRAPGAEHPRRQPRSAEGPAARPDRGDEAPAAGQGMVGLLPRGQAAARSRADPRVTCAIRPREAQGAVAQRIEIPGRGGALSLHPAPRRRDPASAREGRAPSARAHRAPDLRRAGHAVLPIRALHVRRTGPRRGAPRDGQLHPCPGERRGRRVRAPDPHWRRRKAHRAAPGLAARGADARRLRPSSSPSRTTSPTARSRPASASRSRRPSPRSPLRGPRSRRTAPRSRWSVPRSRPAP
jgi:hypothetical protein